MTSVPTSRFVSISVISLFLLFCGLIITIYINSNKKPKKSNGENSDGAAPSIINPILARRAYLNFVYYKSLLRTSRINYLLLHFLYLSSRTDSNKYYDMSLT